MVGHRFRRSFDYEVPRGQLAANEIRFARKNFTHGVWEAWVELGRRRHAEALPDHPEGLWAHAWQVFESRRASVEEERAYLMARRHRDEFWYAKRFGLAWPRLASGGGDLGRDTMAGTSAALKSAISKAGDEFFTPSPPPPPPEPPPTPPCESDPECCDCGCSEAPVRYSDGEVQIAVTDLEAGGFGKTWQHRRVYCNQLSSSADFGNGYNWLVEQWPYLIERADGSITVVRGTRQTLWFDSVGGSYAGRYGAKSTLSHDTVGHVFTLGLPTGERWTFHDFDQGAQPVGMFRSHVTPAGQETRAVSYSGGDRITEIQRSATQDGVTTFQSFFYSYNGEGRTTELTLRNRVDGGAWSEIRKVAYEYYAAGEAHGGLGDLKRVRLQVPQGVGWADIQIHYYRYYLTGDPNGFGHGLKYVVKPNTYATMIADGLDPLSIADTVLAQYADQYLQYDSNQRVTLESLDGGSRTYTFAFTSSGNTDDYNNWAMKTVETRPDGSQNVVYTNYIGQILLKKLTSGTDSWVNYFEFDSEAHQTLAANPSAIVAYNDSSPNLGVALNANAGLIQLTDYYTATGSGAARGYVWREKIQQGSAGTAVVLRSYAYTSRTAGDSTVYPVANLTVYRNDDGTGAASTTYAYTWYAGTTQVQQKTTTLPAVPTSQNGSGTSATTLDYYDIFGNGTWSTDERGFITAFVYNIPTGALARRIDDVDTSQTSGSPVGWNTPTGGGLNLITDYQSDDLGRRTQALGPWHTIDLGGTATNVRRATWIVYQDATYQVWTGQGYATGTAPNYTYILINPVAITKRNAGGNTLEQIQATRSLTSGRLQPTDSFPQSSYVRWTTSQYTDCCLIASQRVYHTIPVTGAGSPGTNYDETDFGYDAMKRHNRTVSPGGTITFDVFDTRDNVIATYVGTDDTGATETDPTGGGAAGNNMVVVTEGQYDDGQSGGDNNLTRVTQYVDATTTRVTTYLYDWRNRQTDVDGEVDFYQKQSYDSLDRVTRTDRYDTTASGNLVARSETKYDDRGRVYQTITYGVDPSTGTVGNTLISNTWYDTANNPIKEQPAGSQLFTKTIYDGLGRPTTRYEGFGSDVTYSDVQSVANNTILEQNENVYDDANNITQFTTRRRYHNAPSSQVGPLGNPSTTPNARVTYSAGYPDPLGQIVALASYGTNGGTDLARFATIPASSDTVLVTTVAYNDRGEEYQTIDPNGRVDHTTFDDAGRRITLIENYVDGVPTNGSPDQDRTTTWTYTPDGQVATLTVVNPATGDQTTTYVYGTTLADSDVATSTLKRYEVYPDSVVGNDQIAFTYDRQQEVTSLTDQNGTIHSYDYDLLGRQVEDRITTLGSGMDGAVLRIQMAYEVRGMIQTITSYDNATAGQGNVVNQAQFAFNDFAQLIADYQEHSGAADLFTSPNVRYGYADGSSNTIRPTSLTYPDGRVLTFDYGTAGGTSDAASRIASLIDDDGITHLADYSYLGAVTVVEVDHPQPQIQFTLIDLSGGNDPDTGDIYSGFDRFGRIKDNRWYNYGTDADADRIHYGYDRAGNRLWRQNTVAETLGRSFDELYSYDCLYRVATMQRGTLSTNQTTIAGMTFAQNWSLDSSGNWANFNEDDNGDGTLDLVQSRTANTVNEITAVTETTGPAWAAPAYDAAGNMTTVLQPNNMTQSYTVTYDAWNRPVRFVDRTSGVTVQVNAYDGRRFPIVRQDFSGGMLAQTRHAYYTADWRVVEERLASGGTVSTSPDRQFVWGRMSLDDLVLRDRSTANNGTLDERLYALNDANLNIVAVANTTGAVQERYAYQAFGIPETLTPAFISQSGSSFGWETLFAGSRSDAGTGLYRVRYRDYNPRLGTWLQRDPEGIDTGSLNLYEYVDSNPINHIDPWGLLTGLLEAPAATIAGPLVATPPGAVAAVGAAATLGSYCLSKYLIGPYLLDPLFYWLNCEDTDPSTEPEPQPEPQPVPDPRPVNPPNPQCRDTCATKFPGWVSCAGYPQSSADAALRARYPYLTSGGASSKRTAATTCGAGGGDHYLYLRTKKAPPAGRKLGSALCCNCCENTPNGPVTKRKCKFVISAN
ncbi:RHS repeat-associated core domain-containing protein [Singulisphaera acidiphila]|uniref:RHS repeat-associated core domain-containing protein n=1 Tax=Singulisphaera acidiphila TaxID=466153 RepID=UPI001ED97355|nr:RHS repeat-associated core domain-containing protein [Singulisphaera acidiphila]